MKALAEERNAEERKKKLCEPLKPLLRERFKEETLSGALEKTERSLTTWQKTATSRRRFQERLVNNLGRPAQELVLHDGDKMRAIVERRAVIRNVMIEEKATIRSGPWELPAKLINRWCDDRQFFVTPTAADAGVKPPFTYVSVPKLIRQHEHGINNEKKKHRHTFLNSEYKKIREDELMVPISEYESHRPDAGDLIVIGHRPKSPITTVLIPTIEVEPYLSKCTPPLHNIYAMRINNSVFYKLRPHQPDLHFKRMKREKWHEDLNEWSYYFNTPVNKRQTKEIFIFNVGSVSLRYCWHELTSYLHYLPKVNVPPVFFFDKNEKILSPGQYRKIKIDCFSDIPGVYPEKWEMLINNVDFLETGKQFSFKFVADIVEDNIDKINAEKECILNSIYSNARNNFIRGLLKDMVEHVVKPTPEYYPYKNNVEEKDEFEMKNPVCFYQATEIKTLRLRYEERTESAWDLNIKTLRNFIKTLGYEDRREEEYRLRNAYKSLLKPQFKEQSIEKRKQKAVKEVLSYFIDSIFDIKTNERNDEIKKADQLNQAFSICIDMMTSNIISININRRIDFSNNILP